MRMPAHLNAITQSGQGILDLGLSLGSIDLELQDLQDAYLARALGICRADRNQAHVSDAELTAWQSVQIIVTRHMCEQRL